MVALADTYRARTVAFISTMYFFPATRTELYSTNIDHACGNGLTNSSTTDKIPLGNECLVRPLYQLGLDVSTGNICSRSILNRFVPKQSMPHSIDQELRVCPWVVPSRAAEVAQCTVFAVCLPVLSMLGAAPIRHCTSPRPCTR